MIPLLLAILPLSPQDTDYADEIEVNRYGDYEECKQPRQLIFWEYRNGVRVVKDYRVHRTEVPVRHGDGWRVQFVEEVFRTVERNGKYYAVEDIRVRNVYAPVLLETRTSNDPEVDDRRRWEEPFHGSPRSGLFHRGPR